MLYLCFMKSYKTIQINKRTIRLHRYLMEKHLGRKLSFNEIVHHRDGDISNNDISNLELMTRAEHLNRHQEIKEASIKAKQKYHYPHDKIVELYCNQRLSTTKIESILNIPYLSLNYYIRKHQLKKQIMYCTCGEIVVIYRCKMCMKCYRNAKRTNKI